MGSISIERFLKSKGIKVPNNLADLVEWNNIKFLEKNCLFSLSESIVPVYAELSIEDFDDIVLIENKNVYDYSKVYAQGLYMNDESEIMESGAAVSVYYSEGKYYLSELYGRNSRYNLIVPIAKNITQKNPEIKFPPFLCRIRNYQFKDDEITPELIEKIKFLLLRTKKNDEKKSNSYIDSYVYIRNGAVEGVLWGWWPNKEGLQLEFEIHFKDKKQLEKLIETFKKIEKINTILGEKIVNIILNDDHQSFQFIYKERTIDSNEIEQILLEENENVPNQVLLPCEENKEKEIFKELQFEQSTKLTAEEKSALVKYKSQLYYPMNKIISLIRNKGGKVEEDEIEKYIKEGYKQLCYAYESNSQIPSFGEPKTTLNEKSNEERIFDSAGFPAYETYKDVVLKNIPGVTLALRKVHLKEDLIVYRYVKNDSFEELGESFLSTSISMKAALSFYNGRNSAKKNPVLYKIKLVKGSPMAFFSEELRTGKVAPDEPFKEDQKEVLIDSYNFNFHIESVEKFENLRIDGKKCPKLYLTEVTAIPKILEMDELIEDKQLNRRSK